MAAAALVLVFFTHALRVRTLVIGLAIAPVALWFLTATNLLRSLLVRDENPQQLTTLNSRTVAWEAALAPRSSLWETWFGGGLQMKRIEVQGQYWNQQILDSSWISALVQGGALGVAICAVWMLSTMVSTRQSPRRLRALQLALLVYLSIRGFFESGLFDASTAFIMFFLAATAHHCEPRPNQALVACQRTRSRQATCQRLPVGRLGSLAGLGRTVIRLAEGRLKLKSVQTVISSLSRLRLLTRLGLMLWSSWLGGLAGGVIVLFEGKTLRVVRGITHAGRVLQSRLR